MHRDIKPSNILFLEDDPFSFELVISGKFLFFYYFKHSYLLFYKICN